MACGIQITWKEKVTLTRKRHLLSESINSKGGQRNFSDSVWGFGVR
jgi:hypothetical protein